MKGFSITKGPHHLDGATALAYARSRKALGESDFTRQARQQQILVALRSEVTRGGSLLFQLPELLDAVGQTIRTDVPVDRLPDLAAILDEVGKKDVTSVVIRAPAREVEEHAVRRFAGTEPGEDPGDGGWAVQRSRRRPDPVADAQAEADQGPEGDAESVRRPLGSLSEPADGQNPSAASFGTMRRAARARCEIAFFSAGVQRPRVRPPGGSLAGSKIGS